MIKEENTKENIKVDNNKTKKEDYFRFFMNETADGIVLFDKELNVVDINKMALNFFNPKENIIGQNIEDLSPNLKETGRLDQYRNVIKTGKPFNAIEVKPHPKFGDFYVNVSAFRIGDGLGVIIRNITEQKKAELDREKAELERIESELMFRNLTEQNIFGITISTKNDIVYVNKRLASMIGYSREELLTWQINDWYHQIHPEDLPIILEGYKKRENEEEYISHYDFRIKKKTGDYLWLQQHSRPIDFKGKSAMQTVLIDISERKTSENNFQIAAEQSLVGIGIVQDDVLKYVNDKYSQINGFTKEEIYNWSKKQYLRYVHPDDLEFVTEQAKKKQAGNTEGIETSYNYRAYKKNGDLLWIELYSKTIKYQGRDAILCAILDVTKRKKIEKNLKESEKLRRTFMDSATDGFLLLDSQFNILDVNHACLKMAGLQRNDIVNKNIKDFIPDFKELNRYNRFLNTMNTGEPFFSEDLIDIEFFKPKYISTKGFKVGKGFGIIISDISERKKAEEALQKSEKTLRIAQEIGKIGSYEWNFLTNELEFSEELQKICGLDENSSKFDMNFVFNNFVHSENRKIVIKYSEGLRKGNIKPLEYRIILGDGSVKYVRNEPGFFKTDINGKQISLFGTIQDIHKRKTNEIELNFVNNSLNMLNKCTEAIISAVDEKKLLTEICIILNEIGNFPAIWMAMPKNPKNNVMEIVSYIGCDENFVNDLNNAYLKMRHRIIGKIIKKAISGKSFVMKESDKLTQAARKSIKFPDYGFKSVATIPLSTVEHFYGSISINSYDEEEFTQKVIEILEELANILALRIETLREQKIDVEKLKNQRDGPISNQLLQQEQVLQSKIIKKKFDSINGIESLDKIDEYIINLLSQDGRMKLVDISHRLSSRAEGGLSDVGVRKRLKKLLNNEFIKIQANMNLTKIKSVIALLLIETENYTASKEIMSKYVNCPRILFSFTTSGKYNMIYGIFAKNLEKLDFYVNACSPKTQKGVRNSKIYISTKSYNPEYFPLWYTKPEKTNDFMCGHICTKCERYLVNDCKGCLNLFNE